MVVVIMVGECGLRYIMVVIVGGSVVNVVGGA